MPKINKKVLEKWKLENKREVIAVKELGEKIGYGNMMSIASALWGLKLKKSQGNSSGAFIPTLPYAMKKVDGEKATEELERRIESFKKLFENE